jgi:hypothetical protein
MNFKKIGFESVECVVLAQDMGQVAGSCENGNESSCSVNCWEFLEKLRK